MPHALLPEPQRARSMGAKLLIVCALALLMMIPALFVSGLVEDRSQRAAEVVREISAHVGGPQTFLGPTLAIPYGTSSIPRQGTYLVFPAQASAAVHVNAEERRRSLFRVPVFQTDAQLSSTFDLTGVPQDLPPGATLDWNHAELVVGVSDPRGALTDATFSSPAGVATLVPAQVASTLNITNEAPSPLSLTLLGAHTPNLNPTSKFTVVAHLRFSGAQRLAVLAYGKSTELIMKGDWPNPGFDGGLLPGTRTVSGHGFEAKWTVPFIARGIQAEGPVGAITGLNATALGVSLVEVADPYQSVNRSLKYAPLFISLVFLTYFLFEATTGRRVHPAQYLLVGIAQILFYLLLLSLAERTGFDWAFALAGAATIALLAGNASWVFASKLQGYRALAGFATLYTLIYVLLRLEDNALLVGAIASFVALSFAMYLTRDLDWYSSLSRLGPDRPEPPPLIPWSTPIPFSLSCSLFPVPPGGLPLNTTPTTRSGMHVAIIMDGNGRWATTRALPRAAGHRAGITAVRRTVEHATELGVRCLTLYAFSSDNWRRPATEIQSIFWLLRIYLRLERERLQQQGVRLEVIGRRDRIPEAALSEIRRTERRTAAGQRLHLRVAVDYSSRHAIARAALNLLSTRRPPAGEHLPDRLTQCLSSGAGDVDLLIRTGGEKRLSDFLLWECAYAELHFTDRLWPDFAADDFERALADFHGRSRRFGGLPDAPLPLVDAGAAR